MKNNKTITKNDDKRKPAGKKAAEEPLSFFAFLRKRNPRLFAHHPDHPAFQDHVWVYHGLYFCKGCIMTFTGMFCGGLFYWLTGWLRWFSELQLGLISLGLLLPSVVTSLLDLPRLSIDIARFLWGVLVASAIVMLFVTDSWAVRLAIVVSYLVVRTPLERIRRRENEAVMAQYRLRSVKQTKSAKISRQV